MITTENKAVASCSLEKTGFILKVMQNESDIITNIAMCVNLKCKFRLLWFWKTSNFILVKPFLQNLCLSQTIAGQLGNQAQIKSAFLRHEILKKYFY